MVKINSTSCLADMRLSSFAKNNKQPHPLRLYLGGKFGEDRWRIAMCRALNSFCVTDWEWE